MPTIIYISAVASIIGGPNVFAVADSSSPFDIKIYDQDGDSFSLRQTLTQDTSSENGLNISFNKDGTYMIVSNDVRGSIYKFDGSNYNLLTSVLPNPSNGLTEVIFHPFTNHFITTHGSGDGYNFYKIEDDEVLHISSISVSPGVPSVSFAIGSRSMAFSKDGLQLAICGRLSPSNIVRVYDVDIGSDGISFSYEISLPPSNYLTTTPTPTSVQFSPDGQYLFVSHTMSQNKVVISGPTTPSNMFYIYCRLYQKSGGVWVLVDDLRTSPPSNTDMFTPYGMAVSDDGQYLALMGDAPLSTPTLRFFKKVGGSLTQLSVDTQPIGEDGLFIRNACFDKDGIRLAVIFDKTMTLYKRTGDALNKMTVSSVDHIDTGPGIAFSPLAIPGSR